MVMFIDKNNSLHNQIEESKERAKLQMLEPTEMEKAVIEVARFLQERDTK